MTLSTLQIEGRLRARLTSQAINDPDFLKLLERGANGIRQAANRASNEATIESAFEQHLFTVLRAIGVDYSPTKEARITGTRLRESGRTDSRFRDVVIEFKHPSELKLPSQIKVHLKQLKDYLQAIGRADGADQIGFLTDGLRFVQCIRNQDGSFKTSAPLRIDGKGLRVICRALVAAKASALRADNLVRDFCCDFGSGHIFVAARELLSSMRRSSTVKSQMLRTEWESLFRLAHEDTSQQRRIESRRAKLEEIFDFRIDNTALEYLCLFSLHTAYSIVVKLISFKVVSDTLFGTTLQDYKELLRSDNLSLQAFCASLEDGEMFRQIGILNLLEGDFFSWYADSAQWNDGIADCVRDILGVLSRYEDARNIFNANKAVDLFRHLYEAAIPQIVRSSFGEFYTPMWLAQHVLVNSGFEVGERVLDPCCGSGTFLIAAIQKIRRHHSRSSSKRALDAVLSCVVGIDLNPLAVLTARIHYFIYISDLLDRAVDRIVIPVFLGDASNVPSVSSGPNGGQVEYALKTLRTPLRISLPLRFVANPQELFSTMNEFEDLLRQGDHTAAREVFEDYASANQFTDVETASLLSLADQISELELREWNGIWARIVANFASTVAIGKFERVIGNPPWIDWKSLPSGYRDTAKEFCLDKGLFSGAGRTGGINLNVCALIAHVAATNWLRRGGKLAFLMPRELAVQASYEGWRSAVGGPDSHLVQFDDWSGAGHPFEPVREDFITFVLQKGGRAPAYIRCTAYERIDRRAQPWLWEDLEEAEQNLQPVRRYAGAIIPDSTAFTFTDSREDLRRFQVIAGRSEYIGREGIEFYPQELVMFRYLSPGPRKGTVFVENFQGVKSKFKIPKQKILLETKFLYPLVKGPFITPFEYEENDLLVAFPYRINDPHRPLSRRVLRRESPLLLAYFLRYEAQFSAQTAYSDAIRKTGEFYGYARTGPYSFAEAYVAFRDNTRWCACVVTDKAMPWGERKRYVFQNHAVSMCEREDRSFISSDEAHYISAVLNCHVVSRFIHASSDSRSFKIRPPIKLPRYSRSNAAHRKLVSLSKRAHRDPGARAGAYAEASAVYFQMCTDSLGLFESSPSRKGLSRSRRGFGGGERRAARVTR